MKVVIVRCDGCGKDEARRYQVIRHEPRNGAKRGGPIVWCRVDWCDECAGSLPGEEGPKVAAI